MPTKNKLIDSFWTLHSSFILARLAFLTTGRSAARLTRLLWEQEIAGSNPAAPTRYNAD